MEKQCRNCSMYTPQLYDGTVQPIGRCMHVSFLKAGFGKPNDVAGAKPEIEHDHMMERLPHDVILELHSRGFYLHDHIDIKMQRGRVCGHWTSPARIADDILTTYNFDWNYVRTFEALSPGLAAWIDAGRPLEDKHFEKLNRISRWEYDVKDLPDAVVASYESCNSCRHFRQDLTAEGQPVPYRGKCRKNTVSEMGVFALTEGQEEPTVFSFMGCTYHSPSPTYNVKEQPQELPVRLTIFIETNPLDLSVAQMDAMFRFPTVTRNRAVEQEEYDGLMDTDLVQTLRLRHGQVDFNSFYADMNMQPIADFFSRGVKAGSKHSKENWGRFQNYAVADDLLFGPEPDAVVEEDKPHDEDAVYREYGSSMAIPQ